MADGSAPVTTAAQEPTSTAPAATVDNGLPKNPFAESQTSKSDESGSNAVAKPLPLAPTAIKPTDTTTATSNGTAATSNGDVDGTEHKTEPIVPTEVKQKNPADSAVGDATGGAAPESTSASHAEPPIMTGALQQPKSDDSTSKPAESTEPDGVHDATGTAADAAAEAKPTESIEPNDSKDAGVSAPKTETANGAEKKDAEMNDAPSLDTTEAAALVDKDAGTKAPTTVPDSKAAPAAAADAPATVSNTEAATSAIPANNEATGEKRKAQPGANGIATEEPAGKKQKKGPVAKAVEKAKDVVEDVKEKVEQKVPARKNSKKTKKETAPVGRTERKTRSQGKAE